MSSDVDYINSSCHDAVIIVADDFNQLNTSLLENDNRLVQIVNGPTHCTHIIDKVLLVVLVFTGVLFTTAFLKLSIVQFLLLVTNRLHICPY